jgi:glycosyltransferase involved in cell wall biosynthesis
MDISVISSLNEGFSNTIIESMARGKPVIATNSGGTAEAVVDGFTGILVEPGNSKALAQAMIKLLDDTSLMERLGRQARENVERHFTIETMMERIESLYKTLLANP